MSIANFRSVWAQNRPVTKYQCFSNLINYFYYLSNNHFQTNHFQKPELKIFAEIFFSKKCRENFSTRSGNIRTHKLDYILGDNNRRKTYVVQRARSCGTGISELKSFLSLRARNADSNSILNHNSYCPSYLSVFSSRSRQLHTSSRPIRDSHRNSDSFDKSTSLKNNDSKNNDNNNRQGSVRQSNNMGSGENNNDGSISNRTLLDGTIDTSANNLYEATDKSKKLQNNPSTTTDKSNKSKMGEFRGCCGVTKNGFARWEAHPLYEKICQAVNATEGEKK
jgi:hypothetical protein